jgi:hypothetical protein
VLFLAFFNPIQQLETDWVIITTMKKLFVFALAVFLLCDTCALNSSAANITYGKKLVKRSWMLLDKSLGKNSRYSLGGYTECPLAYGTDSYYLDKACEVIRANPLRGPSWVYSRDDFYIEINHEFPYSSKKKYVDLKMTFKIVKGHGKLKNVYHHGEMSYAPKNNSRTYVGSAADVESRRTNWKGRFVRGVRFMADPINPVVETEKGCTLRFTLGWKSIKESKWKTVYVDVKIKPRPKR